MDIKFAFSKVISLGVITASIFAAFTTVTPGKAQSFAPKVTGPFTSSPSLLRELNIPTPKVPGPFTSSPSSLTELNTRNKLTQHSPKNIPILRIGSRGQSVRNIQVFLREQGLYRGAIDGIYGQKTAAAVRVFQKRYTSLCNNGVVGQKTWRVILNTVS